MGTAVHLYPLGAVRPLRTQSNTDIKIVFGTFVFSSSYTSGGESLTHADVGLQEIFWLQPNSVAVAVNAAKAMEAIHTAYDYTNEKLIALGASAELASAGQMACEIADNTDLSGYTVKFIAAGRT